MSIKEHPPLHVPVLLDATLELLQPKKGENYLDLTAGYGGHADAFLSITQEHERSCLVDRDDFAIAELGRFSEQGVRLIHDDFVSASRQLVEEGRRFDLLLVDLGVSSPQLDKPQRGFSFTNSGPLDMRMDQNQELTSAKYVNTVRRKDLIQVIQDFGEETHGTARRYADAIIAARPLATTDQLAAAILSAHVGGWQKTHPATRTFQAIRIAINQELKQIELLLPLIPALLAPGGRVGIISFHSLEDRLVKRWLANEAKSGYEAQLDILTKKPRAGTEDVHNPRSRSAKLRVAVKK